MNVLIGFEESGVGRVAFTKLGHNAWSCDLLPTRIPGKHIQGDIMELLLNSNHGYWDLIILHPDCTYLAVSGNRWYGKGTKGNHKRLNSINWTTDVWRLAKTLSKHVALENPKSVIFPVLRKHGAIVQYIHPWQYGHGETKETGLALYGLPELKPTNIVEGREHRVWKMGPSENRKRDRSESYQGIVNAMAEQWG